MLKDLLYGIISGEYELIRFAILLDFISNFWLLNLMRMNIKNVEWHNSLIIASTRMCIATFAIMLVTILQVLVVDLYFKISVVIIGIVALVLMIKVLDLSIWMNIDE